MVKLAMKKAFQSTHEFRHGAVVSKGKRILAVGRNAGGVHAEVAALKKLWPSERQGATVWSVRLTQSGKAMALAKPCPKCEQFMRRHGVKVVYYSMADNEIGMEKL